MAQDITKDVIGVKEFEVQDINQSGESANYFGSITDPNHIINKAYVDALTTDHPHQDVRTTATPEFAALGIDTDSPDEKLHVSGGKILLDNGNQYKIIRADLVNAINVIGLGSDNIVKFVGAHSNSGSKLHQWLPSNNNPVMTLLGGGNLGLNTETPDAKLDVRESAANTKVSMILSGKTIGIPGTTVVELKLLQNENYNAAIRLERGRESTMGRLAFDTKGGGGISQRMLIDEDGNVGINIDNPGAKLDVAGDMLFTGAGSGLPFAEIFVQDNTTATVVTTAGKVNKVQIDIFDTDGLSNNCTPDHTNNHITIVKAGVYQILIPMSAESVAGDGDKLGFSLYKNDGTVEFPNVHSHRDFTAGAAKTGSMILAGKIRVEVGDTLEVWGWNEDDNDNFLVEDITLGCTQIGG